MNNKNLLGILLFLAIFATALTEIIDPDFGWHLKTGEYIVTNMTIPHRDIFSFTAGGARWITEEWLTEVVIYLLYQAGGYLAVMVFFALVPAFALMLVYWRSDAPPFVAALSTLFAAWVASSYWGTRPQMITFLFASIFLFILERYRRQAAGKYIWWLVPLMLIWPNAHGGFAVGPVLILVYLLADTVQVLARWDGDAARLQRPGRLASVLFLSLFAIAFNPNGAEYYLYPFQTLTSPIIQNVVVEWQPPVLGSPAQFPFVLFLTAFLTFLVAARRRFALVDIIMILGLTFASLRATRQIALWVLVAAPILAACASDVLQSLSWQRFARIGTFLERYARVAFAIGGVALAALVVLRANTVTANQANAERRYFPVRAVKFIQDNALAGPIFNRYEWGGYLIWKLYPREKVFIDGRTDVYGLTDPFFYSMYASIYNASPAWRESLAMSNVRLVLVDTLAPITDELAKDARWTQVYDDGQAVVFTRK